MLEIETVSIVIYLSLFLFFNYAPNITEHFCTLSNFYFQGDSDVVQLDQGKATATATGGSHKVIKKMYKCAMITHKKEGSKYQICGKVISKYHISSHMDKHTLSNRFQCKEKISKGVTCNKSYKQKSALIRHLSTKHNKSSLEVARVVIKEKKDVVYETPGDYYYITETQQEKADNINALVEMFGEELYQ